MFFKSLPLLALAAIPSLAQERWQVGLGLNNQLDSEVRYEGPDQAFLKANRKEGLNPSLQVGYRFWDFSRSDLSVNGEYQFWKSSDLFITKFNLPGVGNGEVRTSYRTQFWGPSVQWNFHRAVDCGFGLQYRFAKIEAEGLTANHNRPWANAYVGYTSRAAGNLKPFVALRSSVALSRTGSPGYSALTTDAGQRQLLRSLDGDVEGALQFGVRF